MSDSRGPYVQLAAFCEKALVDRDTDRLSIIGLVDSVKMVAVGPEAPDVMPPTPLVGLTLAICLWSDQFEGEHTILVQPIDPDGDALEPLGLAASFEQGMRGVNLILPIPILLQKAGAYWFNVLLGDPDAERRLLSRIPLEVEYEAQTTPDSVSGSARTP